MKYCVFCGRENVDDAIRCWECGTGDFIFGDDSMRPEEGGEPPADDDPEGDEGNERRSPT
jgi:hypothetical protein